MNSSFPFFFILKKKFKDLLITHKTKMYHLISILKIVLYLVNEFPIPSVFIMYGIYVNYDIIIDYFESLKTPKSYECSICLEQCVENNNKPLGVMIGCGHRFHLECIKHWINSKNNNSSKCPVCRRPLMTPNNSVF